MVEDGPDSRCPLWDQSGRNAGFEKPGKIFGSVLDITVKKGSMLLVRSQTQFYTKNIAYYYYLYPETTVHGQNYIISIIQHPIDDN